MCDSFVVSGAHSASGAAFFAKNSDRHQGECQPWLQFPGALHPRASKAVCTHVSIPQVAETYRVMGHSPWWVWGFEHGVNEHGVAIGNQTVFSQEPVEATPGLIGMDLVRLGLERGRDAREALEVIAALLESHGQGGAALGPGESGYHNSFTIADPQQSWILETSGRRWAARRVELEALTNHITLGTDWQIGSRDLESFARAEGWWRQSGRLDMAVAYRNPHVPPILSEGRLRRSRELLHADGGRHDLETLKSMLRDHFEAGVAPDVALSPEDEAYFTLCMHSEPVGTTTASMVAALPTDRTAPWPVWISFGSPCVGIFIPVYLEGAIPASLAAGGEHDTDGSVWWAFERLRTAAAADYERFVPMLRDGWTTLEEKIEQERLGVEDHARRAAVQGDTDRSGALLSDFMGWIASEVLDAAEEQRARIAG